MNEHKVAVGSKNLQKKMMDSDELRCCCYYFHLEFGLSSPGKKSHLHLQLDFVDVAGGGGGL
jgi:hypothetical protein